MIDCCGHRLSSVGSPHPRSEAFQGAHLFSASCVPRSQGRKQGLWFVKRQEPVEQAEPGSGSARCQGSWTPHPSPDGTGTLPAAPTHSHSHLPKQGSGQATPQEENGQGRQLAGQGRADQERGARPHPQGCRGNASA